MNEEFSEKELEYYMSKCIQIAKSAPDGIRKPHVGCIVLSKDREIVGEGYKKFLDGTSLVLHAERMALDQADNLAKEGYLFSTLEPCARISEYQLLSPCSKLIVESGIDTVVIALLDNSPSMYPGVGIKFLEENGVNVIIYKALNQIIIQGFMPYEYKLKYA